MAGPTRRMRPYTLPAIAVVAFTLAFFTIFYVWGGDSWSWYWWPFYPIGAIIVAFLAAAWTAQRHEGQVPKTER